MHLSAEFGAQSSPNLVHWCTEFGALCTAGAAAHQNGALRLCNTFGKQHRTHSQFSKSSPATMDESLFSNADVYSENQKWKVGKKGHNNGFRLEIQISLI